MAHKSLRDFAAEHGVTLRAVQKHVQKHESELGSHIIRYGPPRGTYLDDEAQAYITERLVGSPVAVMDTTLTDENERLRVELEQARQRIIDLLEERTALTERALQAETVKALAEATSQEQEQKVQDLETKLAETEETLQKLKGRSLWQRIRRWGE